MIPKQAPTVATIGCLVLLLICVFPPRDALQTKEPKARGFLLGAHFDRADVTFNPATKSGTFTRVEVSMGRLLAEMGAVIAATGLSIGLMVMRQNLNVGEGAEPFIEESVREMGERR